MAYYCYRVLGGEFVLCVDRYWQVTFNGVQIGGLYRDPLDALAAVEKRRHGEVPGPNLEGVPDPPADPATWPAR
jgi:hypothetical protein